MDITRLVESAQYVTNYRGQQTAVMLPIDVWDRLRIESWGMKMIGYPA